MIIETVPMKTGKTGYNHLYVANNDREIITLLGGSQQS
jgi:hypothetical protein